MTDETIKIDARPYLILCEGNTDRVLIENLIKKRGIEPRFQVRFPCRGTDRTGGVSKFGKWLNVATNLAGFKSNVKGVILVADSDNDYTESFDRLRENLRVVENFPIPTAEKQIATNRTKLAVAILMVPSGRPGALEDICIDPSYRKWGIKEAVEAFVLATPAKDFAPSKLSKMKMQCIIAATCGTRPECGFAGHWEENELFHIPLDDSEFDEIADFLKLFSTSVPT